MIADAVSWVCRSPRRLAVFAVCVMAVVLIGSSVLSRNGTGDPATSKAADPTASVTAAQVPDSAAFVTAAVRFVHAWSSLPAGESADQWRADLEPLTTDELEQALRTTDPAQLPDSAPEGEPVVRYVAQSSALVAVPLANGSSVLVTVVSDGTGQRVSDVQPYAGDN